MPDSAVAEMIRADEIDILIDLGGHTSRSRVMVFARKPAPVQATYLGYPNTTGLETIDYRLTDAIADPPGEAPAHTEELFRLPRAFCCYAPCASDPPVAHLPAERSGFVTFRLAMHTLARLNRGVLDDTLVRQAVVPSSRLLVFLPYAARQGAGMSCSGYLTSQGDRRRSHRPAKQGQWSRRIRQRQSSFRYFAGHVPLERPYHRVPVALDGCTGHYPAWRPLRRPNGGQRVASRRLAEPGCREHAGITSNWPNLKLAGGILPWPACAPTSASRWPARRCAMPQGSRAIWKRATARCGDEAQRPLTSSF